MKKVISRIEYRYGMIDDASEAPGLPVIKWSGTDIPQDVLKSIRDNKVWELAGSFGNPTLGDPIEYHHLKLEHGDGETEIEFFNLGMSLLGTDDKNIKRIFRVLAILVRMHRDSFAQDNAINNHVEPVKSNRVGRNAPCPCGSGKKYKKCCGAPERLN